MNILDELEARLALRSARVGVIGLGYVGLPLTLRCVDAGFAVTGFDIDQGKVARLNGRESYIEHIASTSISQARDAGFEATTDFAQAAQMDVLVICVPTPLTRFREPDLSCVIDTVDALLPNLRKGQLLSLESTTYPGTTEEELQARVESAGLRVGADFALVYSPEREDPGNRDFSTRTIPKICGGVTPRCLQAGVAFYGAVVDQVVPVSSTRVAEMTKLMENIHRAVNIGLVNEMKIAADGMNIDIHEVIKAAATKPFGFVPYTPGPGLGGHCIPIDPFYLTWKARQYGVHTRFIELAGEINGDMPRWVFGKVQAALNSVKKPVQGSRVMILGVAYKKNVDDLRLSPALNLMELLRDNGALLSYSDPHVAKFKKLREHEFTLESQELTPQVLGAMDCVVLITDHDNFDYELIRQHAALIVDTRGRYCQIRDSHIMHA